MHTGSIIVAVNALVCPFSCERLTRAALFSIQWSNVGLAAQVQGSLLSKGSVTVPNCAEGELDGS